jgi:hypothetical protein
MLRLARNPLPRAETRAGEQPVEHLVDRLLDADVEVHETLRAPTDLVSREENPTLYDIVIRYGKVLYEQG